MNSRITKKFEELKKDNKKALITYVTSGDPDRATTINLVLKMEEAGADIVELGIPYSDPLADGPVIQRASERALKGGTNIDNVFSMVSSIREKTQIPLVFLVYYNSIFKFGIEKFLKKCSDSGIDGLIIPDLPLEERREIKDLMKEYPIDLIALVALTSEDRVRDIVLGSEGFIYCISSKGVTGTRTHFDDELLKLVQQVKKYTEIPLAIGFGISDEKAIKDLKPLSDGLIVGSAIIKKVEEGIKEGGIEERVFQFVKNLKKAVD